MMTETERKESGGFRASDPDLPFLAAEVAIDIDNLLAGRSEDRSAMKRLAGMLLRSIELDTSSALHRSRMDLAAISILNEAVSQSSEAASFKKVEDLLARAIQIASILDEGDPHVDKANLEQVGNFCVALSKAAAAYSESIRNLRPSHPFRRQ